MSVTNGENRAMTSTHRPYVVIHYIDVGVLDVASHHHHHHLLLVVAAPTLLGIRQGMRMGHYLEVASYYVGSRTVHQGAVVHRSYGASRRHRQDLILGS